MKSIAYVGLDVHKKSTTVHIIGDDPRVDLPIARTELSTNRIELVRFLSAFAGKYDLLCCYEASSCGYVVHRWLTAAKIKCEVIATSLIPQRAGDRCKTNRHDARNLARLYRARELTTVRVPTETEESARRLVRLHDQFVKERAKTKINMNQFLRDLGHVYQDGHHWTKRHWVWMRSLSFSGTDALVWLEYLAMLEYKTARIEQIDREIAQISQTEPYAQAVKTLCCFRGIRTLTAMVLLTEVIDWFRFDSAKKLMAWFGLVPSEHSSGEKRHQGSITKTGNVHCRRAIVEAAHKYSRKPRLSKELVTRQEGQPADLIAHSLLAQQRLHKKYWSLANRTAPQKATVAVARELVGFIWAAMTGHCAPKAINTATA